jgi:putative transposase
MLADWIGIDGLHRRKALGLFSLLDGYSRYIVHHELREAQKEFDVEIVMPRIISDNGSQFTARDFKQFVRLVGITHVRTSPYYPQSNGKLERWHGSLKQACIRPASPATIDEARQRVADYVEQYNQTRLHSAIGYITPADKLNGLEKEIFDERDRKLEEARERRALSRQSVACEFVT